jgi:hypothetical protein
MYGRPEKRTGIFFSARNQLVTDGQLIGSPGAREHLMGKKKLAEGQKATALEKNERKN